MTDWQKKVDKGFFSYDLYSLTVLREVVSLLLA